jgi:hypothetical protein
MKKDLILSFAEGDVMTNSELNIIYDQLNTLNDALKERVCYLLKLSN